MQRPLTSNRKASLVHCLGSLFNHPQKVIIFKQIFSKQNFHKTQYDFLERFPAVLHTSDERDVRVRMLEALALLGEGNREHSGTKIAKTFSPELKRQ